MAMARYSKRRRQQLGTETAQNVRHPRVTRLGRRLPLDCRSYCSKAGSDSERLPVASIQEQSSGNGRAKVL
jgi:hypothetical protein